MNSRNLLAHSHLSLAAAAFAVLLVWTAPKASAQDGSMHSQHIGHEGISMAMGEQTQIDATYQRKLLADKVNSITI